MQEQLPRDVGDKRPRDGLAACLRVEIHLSRPGYGTGLKNTDGSLVTWMRLQTISYFRCNPKAQTIRSFQKYPAIHFPALVE